jgi:integrase
LLAVLRRVESRGKLDTAHRVRQLASKVFRFAIASGRAERDPAQDLRGTLTPPRKGHLAAVTDPKLVGPLLLAIDSYVGTPVVVAALRLSPLVFVRPGELRTARWSEIDLEKGEWGIPAERMKMKEPHMVPLSTQAVAILKGLQPVTERSEFVFPGARSLKKPMSENAINAALRYMGVDGETMCGHGFRAMARTILDEVLGFRIDIIEHQLAHAVRDANGRAYNRTSHIDARRQMMQRWADYLDELRVLASSSNVVPLKRNAR